jgi:putative ABC transport system ATP-binding protein
MSVQVRDLVVEYPTGEYRIRPIDGLSFDAQGGALVVLLGASGCGKTTLLSVLGGLLRPTRGHVIVAGTDLSAASSDDLVEHRRTRVGIIFQSFNLVESLTARENVEVALRLSKRPRADRRATADRLLGLVDLANRTTHRPSALSGGQRQRVAIARALANDPKVLLADEPTAHLDFIQVEGVARLLRQLADDGRTVIVATHDQRLVPLADQVIELTAQRTDEPPPGPRQIAPAETLFEQGDRSDFVYVVKAGTVELAREMTDNTRQRLSIAGQGQYFGELGPLLGLPRSATAIAGAGGALVEAVSAHEFRTQASTGLAALQQRPLATPTRANAIAVPVD